MAACAKEWRRPSGRKPCGCRLAGTVRGAVAKIFLVAIVSAQSLTSEARAGDNAMSLYDQRLTYRGAVQALRAGRSGEYRRLAAKLEHYALQPYLVYHAATGRLGNMSARQAEELRGELAATPLAERLYRQWLNAQVRRGRWDVYLAHYEASDAAAARCNYLRALYRSGERGAALAQVRDLWVSAESMPKACDPLFETWIAAGHLDQDTVWARLTLALDANEVGLARYLLRFFDQANAAHGQLYVNVHVQPRNVRRLSRFADNDGGRRALRHGLLRYARLDAEQALALWARVRDEFGFAPADKRYIREQLIAASVEQGGVPDDGPTGFSASAIERIALATVRSEQWDAAALWISAMPPDLAAQPRWRFWRGRALIDGGEAAEAGRGHLAAIAGLRTYYGFLAAADLGAEPKLNAEPPRHDYAAQRMLLGTPAVLRMRELYAVGDLTNARREWRFALTVLNRDQQRHLVELTAGMGWVDQAIFGARDAELGDMVAFRFPLTQIDLYRRYATEVDLPVHLLLAVSRQESAFHTAALSSAGARGLMQLMPATAGLVAARLGMARPSRADLARPHVNVRLGAHHFAALMARYDGNRALAAAAYNAGEGRVRRWRKDADRMPTPVWIERIPFRETRDYVKGVIAFDCVYSRLLGQPAAVLGVHERFVSE